MADWRVARVFVLSALVVGLGAIVYRQGFGFQLGGAPASLDTAYQTEEAWIAGEIVRDITEMSAYAADRTARPDVRQPEALGGSRYKVSPVAALTSPIEVSLAEGPWAPSQFAALAGAALGAKTAQKTQNAKAKSGRAADPVHPALLDMTPERIVRAGQAVSKALANDMRDARAHESAAMVLGAFGLRESAGMFSDVRWTMNRMTAHLAMAAALRGADEPPSIDGALAETVLDVLTRRQARALDRIARLGARTPSPQLDAWRRALQVRVTQDWRVVTLSPSTTAVEELEYLRARRQTVVRQRGILEAESLQVERIDALRIVSADGAMGIADGHVIAQEGMDREREQAAQVYQLMHDRSLFDGQNGENRSRTFDDKVRAQLNTRATRAVGKKGPDVLPWGAWAEHSQRHIGLLIATVDRFWRHRYGDDRQANAARQELDGELSGLTLYPVATSMRTKGVRGGDADLTHINEAIALAVTAPELVTARLWAFLQAGSHYEPVRRGMPPAANWFIVTSAKMPYDAALRVQHVGQVSSSIPLMSALLAEAPFDYWVATEFLKLTKGDAARVLGPRLEYDLRAIHLAADDTKDDQAELALRARSCELAVGECAHYARTLAKMKRVDEAAREFERTFADPTFDRVSFANEAGWLVDYYYERKNIKRALELAEEAAETWAGDGLTTAGYLYERLGRGEDAEEMYERIAARYDDPAQLLGFYYRAIYERKQTQFEEGWKRWLPQTFPEGLQPAASAVASAPKPARGVTVTKDNDRLRKARLQAGDLIIGLDGWRVDNLKQFRAINAFSERPDRKLTVWRGPIYETNLPWRAWYRTSVEFRTYPIQGWAE